MLATVRYCRSLIFAVALLGLTTAPTWAGTAWTPLAQGMEGGQITALAVDPRTPSMVYAAAGYLGLFKSRDAGATWSAASGLPFGLITSLLVDRQTPATVYAVVDTGRLFKSIDGGASWVESGAANLSFLQLDPQTPTTLYAGSLRGGLIRSSDAGTTWSEIKAGLPSNDIIFALAIDPTTTTTLYAGTSSHGIYKSLDGGATWAATNAGLINPPIEILDPQPSLLITRPRIDLSRLPIKALLIDPLTPSTLYASTGAALFKSIDSGAHWLAVAGLAPTDDFGVKLGTNFISALTIDPANPRIVYALTGNGLVTSSDGGNTWAVSQITQGGQVVTALVLDPQSPATLYVGTPAGIFKSRDHGVSWSTANSGLRAVSAVSIVVDPITPTTLYAGTNSAGLFKSNNGGSTWAAANNGLSNPGVQALVIDPQTPNTLYVGTWNGIFKSTDGGASWRESDAGLTYSTVYSLAIDPHTPTTLYAGTYHGLFKSNDGGATWATANSGMPTFSIYALTIDPVRPNILYAVSNFATLFKSSDGGANWVKSETGLDPKPNGTPFLSIGIGTLTIDPAQPNTLYIATSQGVYQSLDAGEHWTATGAQLSNAQFVVIDPDNPTTLYALSGANLFHSLDAGASWGPLTDGHDSGYLGWTSLTLSPAKPATLYATSYGHAGVLSYSVPSGTEPTPNAADRIFSYLASGNSRYLSAEQVTSTTAAGYYYRYYAGSQAYLATKKGTLYYAGPLSSGAMLPLGAQSDYLRTAMQAGF